MRKILAFVLSGCLASLVLQTASAHGVWIANRLDQKQIVLGEGPLDNGYQAYHVQQVNAYNKNWAAVPITQKLHSNYVTVEPADNAAVVTVIFDYGFWSKNTQGKHVNLPMNQVEKSTKGTHAIKYSVNYLSAVNSTKLIDNVPLQIVPQLDPTQLKRGDALPIVVYKDGEPLSHVPVITDVVGNLDLTIMTDEQGRATIIIPNQGLNVLGVEIGFPLENSPLATQEKFFTTLTFTLMPEDD